MRQKNTLTEAFSAKISEGKMNIVKEKTCIMINNDLWSVKAIFV